MDTHNGDYTQHTLYTYEFVVMRIGGRLPKFISVKIQIRLQCGGTMRLWVNTSR
jgi:hypothetical protein